MNFKIFTIISIFTLFSCNSQTLSLNVGNSNLNIEIANTKEQRAEGLMFRKSLKQNNGMLFIFDKEQQVSFWMKNTLIPLSIAYINKKGEIMEIYDMNPRSLEPVPSKRSTVLYALEVNKGFYKQNKISIGDKINLDTLNNYLKSSK